MDQKEPWSRGDVLSGMIIGKRNEECCSPTVFINFINPADAGKVHYAGEDH